MESNWKGSKNFVLVDSNYCSGDYQIIRQNSPHIFKIIQISTLQESKLGIPEILLIKYGKCLSDPIFLKVPTGEFWPIGLTKCDGQVWLRDGWEEFAEYYSLSNGNLLVFRYDGNSNFHVHIFDRNALEIEYSSSSTIDKTSNHYAEVSVPNIEDTVTDIDDSVEILGRISMHKIEGIDDNDSVEILNDIPKGQKRKMKMHSDVIRYKKTRTSSNLWTMPQSFKLDCSQYNKIKLVEPKGDINLHCNKQKIQARQLDHLMGLEVKGSWNFVMVDSNYRSGEYQIIRQNAPLFFKKILRNPLQESKLEIPKKFLTKYGNYLADPVFLKVPTGEFWPIGLTKCDGQVWLRKGWEQFAEYYSLTDEHLLVFRYDGNSSFHMLIFDGNASEIEYASNSTLGQKRKMKMLSDAMSYKKTRNSSSLETKTQSFKLDCSQYNKIKLVEPKGNVILHCSKQKIQGFDIKAPEHRTSIPSSPCHQQSNAPQKSISSIASCKARAFESGNPYFTVIMQKAHVTKKYMLFFPTEFAKRHLPHTHANVILRVSDGRTWCVKYKSSYFRTLLRAYLCSGWKAFVQENHLEVGDACVFEFIKSIEFKVVIYRANDANHCLQESKDSTAETTVGGEIIQKPTYPSITPEKDVKLSFEYPYFKVLIRKCYLEDGTPSIPRNFSRKYIKKHSISATLQVGHKTWSVCSPVHEVGSCNFGCGWLRFMKENSLKVGDICTFKLIDQNEVVFEVSISRSVANQYLSSDGKVIGGDKVTENQNLERDNIALKNSIEAKNPVRMIRGLKLTKTSDSLETKAMTGFTYTDDLVENIRPEVGSHGKLVAKFLLGRLPGQPELVWKKVTNCDKFKEREGLCVDDISYGEETIPISAANTVDDEKPPPFNYITRVRYPDWCRPIPLKGCGCTKGCSDSNKCSCVVKNEGEIPYNSNGAIVEAKPIVYECGPSCKCPPSCSNRVSQHGIKFQLEIFKTKSRGWGVRSLNSIPSGSFICEYIGELLEDTEAERRTDNDEYLFDIGHNCSGSTLLNGISTHISNAEPSACDVVENVGFTIDGAEYGNVGRFINHSCSPNLYAQDVLFDNEDKRIPHIMLFATEHIPPLQELTYHYNYRIDEVLDCMGNIKKKSCYCGSSECTGRMY